MSGERFETPGNVHVESDFYPAARGLREALDRQYTQVTEANAGITPLSYVFIEQACCFLTAAAGRLLPEEALEEFVNYMRGWAERSLQVAHASTPQIRIFTASSHRRVLRDDVPAGWHYLLGLADPAPPRQASWITVVENHAQPAVERSVATASTTVQVPLPFNQLLVHPVSSAYGIETALRTHAPLQGLLFLDGYLW